MLKNVINLVKLAIGLKTPDGTAQVVYVDNAGNVHVGSAVAPIGKMDVSKSGTSASLVVATYANDATSKAAIVGLHSKSDTIGEIAATDDNTSCWSVQGQIVKAGTPDVRFIIAEIIMRQNGASNAPGGDLEFWLSNAGAARTLNHVMLANGNTGFGIAIPEEKLAVNGNIRVKQISRAAGFSETGSLTPETLSIVFDTALPLVGETPAMTGQAIFTCYADDATYAIYKRYRVTWMYDYVKVLDESDPSQDVPSVFGLQFSRDAGNLRITASAELISGAVSFSLKGVFTDFVTWSHNER